MGESLDVLYDAPDFHCVAVEACQFGRRLITSDRLPLVRPVAESVLHTHTHTAETHQDNDVVLKPSTAAIGGER